MKPDSELSVNILDEIIPKIMNFVKKPYSEIQSLLLRYSNGGYMFDRLKWKKKEFASWFLNLDDENQADVIDLLDIKLSKPEKELKKHSENPAEILAYYSILGENKWTYQPVELVLLRGFLVFSLNHSSLRVFDFAFSNSKPLIDFKGWATFWLEVKKMNDTKVVIPERCKIPDYIVNSYRFQ